MNARFWAFATLLSGAIALGLFVIFALLPEVRAASVCLPPGSVVQFELARNAADLIEIFGAADSECRPLSIAAMDAVNRIDLAAFIPAYSLFCICAALFLASGEWRRPLVIVAVGVAVAAAAADYLETTTLLAITQTLDTPEQFLRYSQLGAWSKFVFLAAHAVFCAGICYASEKQRLVLGTVLMLPAFGVAAAFYDHVALANVMNAAFAAAWIGLLAMALVSLVQAKGAPA